MGIDVAHPGNRVSLLLITKISTFYLDNCIMYFPSRLKLLTFHVAMRQFKEYSSHPLLIQRQIRRGKLMTLLIYF